MRPPFEQSSKAGSPPEMLQLQLSAFELLDDVSEPLQRLRV